MKVTKRARLAGAGCGLLAAAAGLGAAEGVATLVSAPSPVVSVGEQAIDRAPPFAKDFAVETFGESDKLVLVLGVVIVLAIVAAVAGAIGVTRPRLAVAIAAALGIVGLVAAVSGNAVTVPFIPSVLPGLAATLVSAGGLGLLLSSLRTQAAPERQDATVSSDTLDHRDDVAAVRVTADAPDGFDRRRFLGAAAAVGVVGVVGGTYARLGRTTIDVSATQIPVAGDLAGPMPAGTSFADVDGLSSFVTPNEDFYRVDTALTVPQVDSATWRLRVHGMVDNEIELDFAQLVDRTLVERDITLTCVSNEVGGPYVGNARWIGTPIKDLLEEAGIQEGADAVLSTSVDGMTIGTPLEALTDGRDALLAVGMNGDPLPAAHGFPVRMVVPGLYGYVSATKWVVDLEVTRFADFEAYWTPRGWAELGPIKVASRIDVPQPFASFPPGPITVAGVAWAQQIGIDKVEVSVDGGDWQPAELSEELNVDTWRQWRFDWDASGVSGGTHEIQVRATNRAGETQTDERRPPRPDGATGWHSVVVTVG